MTLASRDVQKNCSRMRVWTFNGTSALWGGEGEKVSDFEGGKFGRKRLKAKERQLPVLHHASFT